jgi:hypothetical protein
MTRPRVLVAVLMRRELLDNPWQSHRWSLHAVEPDDSPAGAPRLVQDDGRTQLWRHTGFAVELLRSDAEGYYLNLTTPAPGWFVMWRMEEEAGASGEILALPQVVSLSYHDAGRWLDAQEQLEQVPAPPEVVQWLGEFVQAHYVPEEKKRKRPVSFQPLKDRFGQPASVSTEKPRKGGDHG